MLFKNHDITICITGYYLQAFRMFCKSIMNIATVKTVIYYVMQCYINCLNCAQYTEMIPPPQLNIKYSTWLLILLQLNFFFYIQYIIFSLIKLWTQSTCLMSYPVCGVFWFFVCLFVLNQMNYLYCLINLHNFAVFCKKFIRI